MSRTKTQTPEGRHYSVEEVGQVIRTASTLVVREQDSSAPAPRMELELSELKQLAQELGISESALTRAIPLADEQRKRAEKRTRSKMRFWRHLLGYSSIVGGFSVIDFLGGDGFWVPIPAILWGIVLVMHGLRTFVTGKEGRLHRALLKQELETQRQLGP